MPSTLVDDHRRQNTVLFYSLLSFAPTISLSLSLSSSSLCLMPSGHVLFVCLSLSLLSFSCFRRKERQNFVRRKSNTESLFSPNTKRERREEIRLRNYVLQFEDRTRPVYVIWRKRESLIYSYISSFVSDWSFHVFPSHCICCLQILCCCLEDDDDDGDDEITLLDFVFIHECLSRKEKNNWKVIFEERKLMRNTWRRHFRINPFFTFHWFHCHFPFREY